jgi:hypothetical protein
MPSQSSGSYEMKDLSQYTQYLGRDLNRTTPEKVQGVTATPACSVVIIIIIIIIIIICGRYNP